MAKLLRLDVAQLTDVGRKREHNEDNMAYVIPKDPAVMARKGALFIVADGMGGHAAGEVASEIAVDTVSNTYYQDDNDDVPTSLLSSIRRANAAIHQRAAENMLRSGMGTTCVAVVLRGNMAYIANVGDSRAYLVRHARIRQVSQDHSWVAEQVRAGLLTEEQARTHAQRNVITRSLGTQTEVDVDIFREILEEGDTFILCSDGLSGSVLDEELQHTIGQFGPQESVYHMVERANENGGPDNITAIVARVQEVGVEPPNVRQPVPVGGPEISEEDTARLFAPVGAASANLAIRNGEIPVPGSPFPYISGSLASPDHDIASKTALRSRKRYGRLFYPGIVLLILFVLVAGGSGIYYFVHTNPAKTISNAFANATQSIQKANTEISSNAAQALQDLSNAQKQLQSLKNYSLNASDSATLISLQIQLVSYTKAAIINYNSNQAAQIVLLPCKTSTPNSVSNGTQAQTVALIQSGNNTLSYVLEKNGSIFQLVSSGNGSEDTLKLAGSAPTNTQFISMVGAGTEIFALSGPVNNTTPGNYAINVLAPDAKGDGTLSVLQSKAISNASLTQGGNAPTLITAWGHTTGANTVYSVYVVLSSSTNTNATFNASILSYSVDSKNTFGTPSNTTISVSANIIGITAFPDRLFLLLSEGDVLSLQTSELANASSAKPTPVLANPEVLPPLANETQNFSANDTVPTAPQKQSTQGGSGAFTLAIPSGNGQSETDLPTMSAGMVGSTNYLYTTDPANHSVLELEIAASGKGGGPNATPTTTPTETLSSNSTTLQLVQQYVSPTSFATIQSVALDPKGSDVNILSQDNANQETLLTINAGPGQACAS